MNRIVGAAVAAAMTVFSMTGIAQAEGTLRIAVPSNLNTLDPARAKLGEEYIVNFLVYSGLTEISADGEVRPDLAESWEANDDLTEWTFTLREGATFHDGSPVEAADVKATIERVMDPAIASTARANFAIVSAIDVIDERTIRFTLDQPYSGFAEILGDRQVRIVPRDGADTLDEEPIGSGPFKLTLFKPGNRIELQRNEDYYVEDMPRLDAITIRIIPERSSQLAALEAGEIDLVWDVPPEAVAEYQGRDNIVIDSVPTSTWDGIIMNAAQEPFDDERVRQAVALALDKHALVEIALFGNGTATHTMIPPTHPFYNDKLEIPAPDPDRARELLAEAGYENGFDITLYVPVGRPTRERVGVGAVPMLAEVGIRAEIQRVPWDRFVAEIEGKAAFYSDGFYSRPTIDTSVFPWYHSSGSWNTTLWNYSNPEMDEVLEAARAATTNEERAGYYKEFQRLAVEQPAGVVVYVQNHTNMLSPRVQNFSSHPMMWLDLRGVTVE